MYTLCFKNGIGGRLQLPDDLEFRSCLFSYTQAPFSGNNTFFDCFTLEATVHTLY